MINELTVNQIGGLFNQLYNLEEKLTDGEITDGFLNINSIFWSEILNFDNIKNMILELQKKDIVYSTKLNAVRNNPEMFYKVFNEAINNINCQTLDAKTEFSYLETLQIVCHLHTYLCSSPFELTIYEGYKHNQFSSMELKRNCILKYSNPYYEFIKNKIIPKINCKDLNILWMKGRPNISGFCLASLIKEINPNVFIVSIDNNSEFFSFSKITSLLKENHPFFSVFDCVVLNDDISTYKQIRENINNKKSIKNIDNIIYSLDKGNEIICTKRSSQKTTQVSLLKKELDHIVNIKLFPKNHCYWNKCSFCAINKKYVCTTNDWNIDSLLLTLKKMSEIGIDKFWALDEAIPIDTLSKISNAIIENNLKFNWHVRTRIEKEILADNLPKKLYNAGLRHILLGFESASPRILNFMNKTDHSNEYLDLSEKIVKAFNEIKIHVHFPVIIGFPTESQSERNKTFEFVNYLKNKYPYFSYNINILNLDVSSTLYNNWSKYNISSLEYPCEPYYFIGNSVLWKCNNSDISIKELELQAIESMKAQFPWYPKDSLLDIISFYSMWEYSRSQLHISCQEKDLIDESNNISDEANLYIAPETIMFMDSDDLYCLYNFKNHNCIRGGKIIHDIYEYIKRYSSLDAYLRTFDKSIHVRIYQFIADLIQFGFIKSIIN